MGGQVVVDPVAEDVGPEELFEHAEDAPALLVGEDVEHPLGLLGPPHMEFHRPGGMQSVDGHGRFPLDAEAHPPLPLGAEGVDGQYLHERCERLVEPDAVPPLHGDQIAEPHVGDLVADHVGHPLELHPGRLVRVHQENRLAEGHTPQVFHGTEGEVGYGHQIEFVGGVGDTEVLAEVAEGMGPDGEGERGQVALARAVDDPQRDAVDFERLGGLQRSDHEGDQIGRHHHGGGEPDPALPVRSGALLDHGAVGEGGEGVVDHQGDLEGGFELGFIETGEGTAGVGRLHLGGGDGVFGAGLVGEGGPVEPVELVVENAGEGQMQGGRALLEGLGESECGPLFVAVEIDGGGDEGPAAVGIAVVELGEGDGQLGRVESDRGGRLHHRKVDLDVAAEGGCGEVGREH